MCSYQIIHFTLYISGILRKNGSIDNDASIKRLAEISLAYAKAG
jgi:delta-aminolevulinic acid dehydratase/porphobilinogen synthase